MACTKRQRSPTPFSTAFSRATSTASASLSPPITGRCHSLAMAIAKMPLPQPTSTALAVSARSSVASIFRQPRVVACVPVPNAMPASILSGSRPAGMPAGVMRGMDPERARRRTAGTSAGSRPPNPCRPAPPSASRRRSPPRPRPSSPSPKISMRHGPSRETSRLVTRSPSRRDAPAPASREARSAAGTSSQAVQTLTPPR